MAVSIKKKPTEKVTSMSAPVRSGNGSRVMTTKWKYPKAATDQKSDKRATKVVVRTGLEGRTSTKDYFLKQDVEYGSMPTEVERNLGSITINGKTWTRNDFYPYTSRKLLLFWTHVKLANSKGEGPWQSVKREFKAPRKPSISKIEHDGEGELSCTITTDPGHDYRERTRTYYTVEMVDGRKNNPNKPSKKEYDSQQLSFLVYRSFAYYLQLEYDEYIMMRVRSCAQGYAGNSDFVEQTHYISWPPLPVIKDIRIPSTEQDGKVTVLINLKSDDPSHDADWNKTYNTQHPVTGCRLEILTGSEAETPDEANADDGWEPVDYNSGGNCTALATTVAELTSQRGLHTWIRVKSWNDIESIYYRYSTPVEVTKLFREPPGQSESSIVINSAVSGDDGKSVVLNLVWNANGLDTMTGTEVSWSEDKNAWRSTSGPNVHDFRWSDGQQVVGQVTYNDSATIHVSGLTEGTLYHFRARRYQERDGADRLYGEYSQNVMTAMPATSPTSVTMHMASTVPVNRPLEVTWSYDSDSIQTYYEVITGDTVTVEVEDGKDETYIDPDTVVVLTTGNDANGSYVIPAEDISENADEGAIALAVRVSTGGNLVESQAVVVLIKNPPDLEVADPVVYSQPLFCYISTDIESTYAMVTVTSQGVDGELPDGSIAQVAGDSVWSGRVDLSWAYNVRDERYYALLVLPEDSVLPLYDGCLYDMEITLVDTVTGLRSESKVAEILIDWDDKAHEPSDSITVTGFDTTDLDGNRTVGATIKLVAPTDAHAHEVYDVYRVSDDGAHLIASGAGLTDTVTDNYASFGNRTLSYRVVCRTRDGDQDWTDYEYTLLPRPVTDGLFMRIDFGSRYIELDRGVSYADKRSKSFSAREHLGSKFDVGYWGDHIKRTGSGAAAAIVVYEQSQIELMDQLSVYNGPCYVRLSNGIAYEANVDVSQTSYPLNSAAAAYTLDITQVKLTDEYMAVEPVLYDD